MQFGSRCWCKLGASWPDHLSFMSQTWGWNQVLALNPNVRLHSVQSRADMCPVPCLCPAIVPTRFLGPLCQFPSLSTGKLLVWLGRVLHTPIWGVEVQGDLHLLDAVHMFHTNKSILLSTTLPCSLSPPE